MRYHFVCFATASVLLQCCGCGKDDGRIEVYPVSGKVLVNDVPAEKAKVVFYPVSENLRQPGMPIPSAHTDAVGEFRLRSYDPDDGAPAGEYNVSIIWLDKKAGDDETQESKDRLGMRYFDPHKSGLKVTIEEGGAELPPFKLQ
jgi:hypothetical protein